MRPKTETSGRRGCDGLAVMTFRTAVACRPYATRSGGQRDRIGERVPTSHLEARPRLRRARSADHAACSHAFRPSNATTGATWVRAEEARTHGTNGHHR